MTKDLRRLRPVITRWMSLRHWRSQVLFWGGGLLVGVAGVAVAMLADRALAVFQLMRSHYPLLPLLLTPAGFALCAYVARRWFPGSQGSGIPQVIAATDAVRRNPSAGDKLVSLRVSAGKTVLLFIGLLCGASIGREGPTVQIGASLMRVTGRIGGIISNESALLLAGGAAGVAAAFNTPLAGIVFAIEELGKSFEQRTSGTVIFTVMLAGIASLALVGDYTYFGRAPVHVLGWVDAAAVMVCGIGGGTLGGAFSRLLIFGIKRLGGLWGGLIDRHRIAFAAGCGFVLAVIGYLTNGEIFGTGYPEAKALVTGAGHLPHGFGLVKMAGTLLSSVSGIPGGLFAPSLSAGAGVGADLHLLLPMAPLATMALLGMVGYFSGVVQSPLTSFVIVLEMTNDTNMIIPIMATSLLAYSVSRLICPRPLYHSLAQPFMKQVREQVQSEHT